MKKYIFTAVFCLLTAVSVGAQSKKSAQVSKLYQNYIAIKSALASDDADKTSKASSDFIKTASAIDAKTVSQKDLNILKKEASAIFGTKNISIQRKSFYQLSDSMIALTKEFRLSESPVYVQYCPMAEGSWLSNEKKVINPYYGSSMPSCGTVKAEIK
jgi:hypothetical protein